ncbi:ankyrin repeat-containing domain protein [Lasiosphaeris hirsuta]|uniref:protein S-acyltransferase n=1 Tax=Lasiosphaeris hirsuta TaxID=260670 RepID=A0AA40DKD2_9PEZI|nr:ankyrin repeat-containing domain protein [Lasiosphaeris hirsuta]
MGCVRYLEARLHVSHASNAVGRWPTDSEGGTPLHWAAKSPGNEKMVGFLLEKGCPIDHEDQHGYTALHHAANTGDIIMAKLLLDWNPEGSRVNKATKNGHRPLDYAAYKGHLDMVKFLIDKGAIVRNNPCQCYFRDTTFLTATRCGIGRGSSNQTTYTPYWATRMERVSSILQILVERGADPNVLDGDGKSAYQNMVDW